MRKNGEQSELTNGPIVRLGDSVLMNVRFLSRSVTDIFDEALRSSNISSAQFVLLSMIGQRGSITRAEIARVQHLDRSTLTRGLKSILFEGWAEEVRDNANGRTRPIALTAAGKDLLVNAEPAWLAAQARAKARLGQDGTMALVAMADRITHPPEPSPHERKEPVSPAD